LLNWLALGIWFSMGGAFLLYSPCSIGGAFLLYSPCSVRGSSLLGSSLLGIAFSGIAFSGIAFSGSAFSWLGSAFSWLGSAFSWLGSAFSWLGTAFSTPTPWLRSDTWACTVVSTSSSSADVAHPVAAKHAKPESTSAVAMFAKYLMVPCLPVTGSAR